jgi:hypothetical protein
MRKIAITILIFLGSFSMASAELGVNIGVSGQMGVFHATGLDKDTDTVGTDTQKDDATGVIGYTSFFIEKTLGQYITVGYDYSPNTLSSATANNDKCDNNAVAANVQVPASNGGSCQVAVSVNKVKLDFSDMTQTYVALNVTPNVYLKAGITSMDVATQESLATGATYKNFTLDGTIMAVGFNKTFDNTMFVRAEGSYSEFDTHSATSGDHKITIKDFEGVSAKLSIGKSF